MSARGASFIVDLYQPLYATRPKVVPDLYASLRPQVYDAGFTGAMDSVRLSKSANQGVSMRERGIRAGSRAMHRRAR